MMSAIRQLLLLRLLISAVVLSFHLSVSATSLQEAFDNAVKVDPTLRASRFNQEATKENLVIAKSRLFPQVSLQGASNQLTQTTTQDIPGSISVSRSFTGPSVNHQLVIRQGLLRPKDIYGLNFAELQAKYGQVKYQADLSDLWTRVTFSWIDLVGAAQLVEVYERPLKSLLAAAKQENSRLTQGDGTRDAAIEAEAQYQLAVATHHQALQILKSKQRAFEVLTQVDTKPILSLRLELNPTPKFSEIDRDRLWINAREKSFDIRFAELQELMQRERVRMSKADHLPSLDVIASWNVAKNDATSTQGYRYSNNQVGIQYTVPIYSGGLISAAARQASLALEASLAEKEAVSNRVEGEFRALWASWLGQIARVRAGFQMMESSREQLKASELSHLHGVKTLMEVANAELTFSRRLADQVNLVMEYQKYTARVSRTDFNLEK
jgi:outer membrane protein, protease secretion system